MHGYSESGPGSAFVSTTSKAINQAGLNSYDTAPAPRSTPTMGELLESASAALSRLQNIAASVEAIGDKLSGSQPQKDGTGSAASPGAGSIGQLASLLSMTHATIDRIDVGLDRLHRAHG